MINKLAPNHIAQILQSWKNGWELMQNDGIFIPDLRYFDQEDKLNIRVINGQDPNELINYYVNIGPTPVLGIMQHCGEVVKDGKLRRCLVSRIKTRDTDIFKILFIDQAYDFNNEQLLDEVEEIQPADARSKISYIFQPMFGNKRITVGATNQDFSELAKAADEAREKKDWNLLKAVINENNVNLRGAGGDTILQWVMYGAPEDVIEFLLKKGADPNIANYRYGRNAAYYADTLEKHKLLVEHGLNINHVDTSGWTAARYKMHVRGVFEYYLDRGLDLSLKSINGRNVAIDLVEQDNKLLALVASRGIDLNEPDRWGLTALHYAILAVDAEATGIILEHGGDRNLKTQLEYNHSLDDNGIVVPAGSDAKDVLAAVKKWRDVATGEWAKNTVKSTAKDFETIRRLITLGISPGTIQKEENDKRAQAQNTAEDKLSSLINRYQQNEGHFRRKAKALLIFSRLGTLLFLAGLVLLILKLFSVSTGLWWLYLVIGGLVVKRLVKVGLGKLVKE